MHTFVGKIQTSFRNTVNAQIEAFRRMPLPGVVALLGLLVAGLGSAQAHHTAARDGSARALQAQHAECPTGNPPSSAAAALCPEEVGNADFAFKSGR